MFYSIASRDVGLLEGPGLEASLLALWAPPPPHVHTARASFSAGSSSSSASPFILSEHARAG
jgi:hypothetical protein